MSDCHSSARCDENQSVVGHTSTTVHNVHEAYDIQRNSFLLGFVEDGDARTIVLRNGTVWEEYELGATLLQTSTRTISAAEALEKGLLPPVRFRWEQHMILSSVKGAEDLAGKHTLKIEFDEESEEAQDGQANCQNEDAILDDI